MLRQTVARLHLRVVPIVPNSYPIGILNERGNPDTHLVVQHTQCISKFSLN